jgi:hypothetical protein
MSRIVLLEEIDPEHLNERRKEVMLLLHNGIPEKADAVKRIMLSLRLTWCSRFCRPSQSIACQSVGVATVKMIGPQLIVPPRIAGYD